MKRVVGALAALAIGASGCTYHIGTVGLIAPYPVQAVEHQRLGRTRGRSCTWIRLVPNLDGALARALSRHPEANALANVEVLVNIQYYIVVARICVVVDADAVKVGEP